MLVIKKSKDLKIEKNLGKIFKEHNILEYKSPSDNLALSDYSKVKGYAYLYCAFENITPQQVTITFIVPELTAVLRSYLTNVEGFDITVVDDGICYVDDKSFSVQVIEQKKLSVDKNLFVGTLNKSVTAVDMNKLLNEVHQRGIALKNNPFIEVVAKANLDIVEEVINMQTELTFDEFITEWGVKRGMVDNVQRMKEIAKKMLNIGEPLEKIALITDLDIATIESLR